MKYTKDNEVIRLIAVLRWGPRHLADVRRVYLSYSEIGKLVHKSIPSIRRYCLLYEQKMASQSEDDAHRGYPVLADGRKTRHEGKRPTQE